MPCEICISRAPYPTRYRERIQLESGPELNQRGNREAQSEANPNDDGASFEESKRRVALITNLTTGGTSGWNSRKFDPNGDPLRYRYELLADHLARMILTGEIPPSKPLPAERRLADEYGVSLATARRAVQELRIRGLAYTLRSKGTFVLPVERKYQQYHVTNH
jgi:GntR family transcriptional regulator